MALTPDDLSQIGELIAASEKRISQQLSVQSAGLHNVEGRMIELFAGLDGRLAHINSRFDQISEALIYIASVRPGARPGHQS